MKSAYFTIHPGKNPPPQNGCRLKSVIFLKHRVHISTFPTQPDFSQNHYTKYWFSPDIASLTSKKYCHALSFYKELGGDSY
jgi:hypothetical protein